MKTNHKPEIGRLDQLEARLRAERPVFAAPAGFTERVMERLGRQEPARRAPSEPSAFRLLLAFAGAACLTLAGLRWFPARQPAADPRQLAEAFSKIKIPAISATQVEALTARLDQPLETELKNVISDTRQAIQFVASNFLPENQPR